MASVEDESVLFEAQRAEDFRGFCGGGRENVTTVGSKRANASNLLNYLIDVLIL